MGQIGEAKIPDLNPQEAINIAEILITEFDGESPDEEAFARSIGHETANSGAFRSKLADLRRYGLVSSRGISATRLAFDLTFPDNNQEFNQNYFKMIQNISLLSEFYERVSDMEPDSQVDIADVLVELTGADYEEVNDSIDDIIELYNEMQNAKSSGGLKFHNVWSADTAETNDSLIRRARRNLAIGTGHGSSPTRSENTSEKGWSKTVPENTLPEVAIHVQVEDEQVRLAERNEQNLELAIQFLKSKLSETGSESTQTTLETE